jgi:hypothetical protein
MLIEPGREKDVQGGFGSVFGWAVFERHEGAKWSTGRIMDESNIRHQDWMVIFVDKLLEKSVKGVSVPCFPC